MYSWLVSMNLKRISNEDRKDSGNSFADAGFIYDSVCRANVKMGEFGLWRAGNNIQVQEPAFIPRSETCEYGNGYLIVFLSHMDTMLSSLAILDTSDLPAGPVARILLPFRLKSGIHGSWVITIPREISDDRFLP
jgi:carotenoid cleavage dioxygenase